MLMLITHPTNAAKNGCARATWAWTSSLALWALGSVLKFFFFFFVAYLRRRDEGLVGTQRKR